MSGSTSYFRLGEWLVKPSENAFESGDRRSVVEPRAMEVLLYMAENPNTILTSEQLLNECWAGTFYGDNPVHKAIAQLRKALKDKASQPEYIETIRKRGYRLIAPVSFPDGEHRPKSQVTWSDGSPYLGLEAFDSRHAGIFFGRGEAIAGLTTRIKHQVQDVLPFVLILGPSGSGKTSLIHAGILPLLTAEHGTEDILGVSNVTLNMGGQQADDPVMAMVDAISQWDIDNKPIFSDNQRPDLEQWLRNEQYDELIEQLDRALNRYRFVHHIPESTTTLLCMVVDQFEKLCANPEITESARNHFMDVLAELVHSGKVLVLAASRNDFYQEITRLRHITELKSGNGQLDILPPTSGEISEMIRNPALAAGLTFEQDQETLIWLDDQIRDDAITHPDILPLLQYTLNELYLNRDENNCLCFAAYHDMGGLQGALSQKVESVVQALDQPAQNSLDSLLGRLVMQRDDETVSSRSADWDKIDDPNEQQLAQALIDSRLLISEYSNNRHTISVTHEALFVHWPRARDWIDNNRELLRSYANLSTASQRWLDEDCSSDYLLGSGKPLLEARLLSDSHRIQLDDNDKTFIQASIKRASRRTQLRNLAIATVTALGIVAGVASVIANDARKTAVERQAQAENLVGFMLGDLMDRLRPLGRLNLLDVVGDEAMRYLGSQDTSDANQETQLLRANALIQIGEIRITQAESTEAEAAFSEANDILENLIQERPAHGPTLLQAGNAKYWLGYLNYLEHNLDDAAQEWQGYKDHAQQWVDLEPENLDAKMELSYAWNNLGTLANANRQLNDATIYFEQSTDLKQQVLTARPGDTALAIELADSYSWTARTAQRTGLLDKASDYFQEEIDLMDSLFMADQDNTQVLYRLIVAKLNSGRILSELDSPEKAVDIFQTAIQQMQSLIDIDPSNKEWLRVYAYLLIDYGWTYYKLSQFNLAKQQLEHSHEVMQQLTTSNSRNIEWQRSLLNTQHRLAQIMYQLRETTEAEQLINETLANTQQLYQSNDKDTLTRILLAEILITKGEWVCESDRSTAANLWRSSMEILEPIAAESKDTRILSPLLKAKSNLNFEIDDLVKQFESMGYKPALLGTYFYNKLENNICRKTTQSL